MLKRNTPLKARKGFKKASYPEAVEKWHSGPLKRKKLRSASIKRAAELREYSKLRKEFLSQNQYCAVRFPEQATQVHHSRGKLGRLLNDMRWWIPISAAGHRWIEENHREARKMHWNGIHLMCQPSEFNTYPE